MPGDDNENGRRFRPTMTGPIPQTPELPFRTHDTANPERKQSKAGAGSKDIMDLEALPGAAGITPSYRMFDTTTVPVPQQLSCHFYSSFRPASQEQSSDARGVDNVIRQTLPVETTTDGTHVPGVNNIKASPAPKHWSGPAAKDSALPYTRIGLDIQEAELEILGSRKKRLGSIELPQAASKRARLTASDSSFSSDSTIGLPTMPRTHAQRTYISTKIPDNQTVPRTTRSKASNQRKRYIEDDTDDEEEKSQTSAENQNVQVIFKAPYRSTRERATTTMNSIIAAWGERNLNSIPGDVSKGSLHDALGAWVSGRNVPSFEKARSWVNYATVMRLKHGGRGHQNTPHAIREDWDKAWQRQARYNNVTLEGGGMTVMMSDGGLRDAPELLDGDLEELALKIDEETGFLKADASRKRKPKPKSRNKRKSKAEIKRSKVSFPPRQTLRIESPDFESDLPELCTSDSEY